jgi:hypothetical protein
MKIRGSRSNSNKIVVLALAVGMVAVCHFGFGADKVVIGEYFNATW